MKAFRTTPGEPGSATFALAPGFRATATSCGLKESGALDLALVATERPASGAGVFTSNRVQAAPVTYDREILARSPERLRAVLANSGCANACTGPRGLEDARRMAALAAGPLGCRPDEVLVLSTGVIGRFLDMEKVERGVGRLFSTEARVGAEHAAAAILTTDTRSKTAREEIELGGRGVTVAGFAKGAGMIHPQMATMLAVLTTDAACAPERLRSCLASAVERSFNRISVDGDQSTNDTVLLLASGAAGVEIEDRNAGSFTEGLTRVCVSLAKQIARDGEGATRLVEITVAGAASEARAHRVADAIARSLLVKTAIHGADPNWGRILAAAGYSGEAIDPDRLALSFGAAGERVALVRDGLAVAYDSGAASGLLRRDPVEIRLELGLGSAEATCWTCDLSADYVAINAHYTT